MKGKVKSAELIMGRDGQPTTDSYGNYASTIEFEDGTKGYYTHKEMDDSYFTVGSEVEYTAETKESASGNSYTRIGKPRSGGYGGGGKGWVPPTKSELKRNAVGYAAGYVKDLVVAGSIELKEYGKTLTSIMKAISAEIDKID